MSRSAWVTILLMAAVTVLGCAQRYIVPSAVLMRGDVVQDVDVKTADGYEYSFDQAQVKGDVLVGTLVEEVEVVADNGDVSVKKEARDVELPISTVVKVEGVKRVVSSNALYVVGTLGAGAVVYAVVSGSDLIDGRQRGSGPAVKPIPK